MTLDRKEVVLSGIRATGKMHLGNYLGVLERFARLSRDATRTCLFFVADLHTLTTHKEARLIRSQAPEIVLDILAAGVDPETAAIYVQSHVPRVTELAWYLACLSPVGELERMPTFKDKEDKHPDDVNAGLFNYPVLMAADILGPRADLVPVGQDQMPHLEFTRELARRFNRLYGQYFPIPDKMEDESVLIPGLTVWDPEKRVFGKMGKSEAPLQTLYLNDASEANREKLLRAPTDPARARRTDPGTPEICVLYRMHQLLSTDDEQRWSREGCKTAAISCLECKEVVAKNLETRLADFRRRRRELAAQPERITEIIAAGDARAQALFNETTAYVADKMGVFRPTVT